MLFDFQIRQLSLTFLLSLFCNYFPVIWSNIYICIQQLMVIDSIKLDMLVTLTAILFNQVTAHAKAKTISRWIDYLIDRKLA